MNCHNYISRCAPRRNVNAIRAMVVVGLFGLATTAQAAVVASSSFTADAEGWTGLSCPNPGVCALGADPLAVQHLVAGGNPGGYIRTKDPSNTHAGRVTPPSTFSSNFALGQILSFDVLVEKNGGDGVFDATLAPLVTIESASGTLVYGTTDFPIIDGPWKHYEVPFAADPNWSIFAGGALRALLPGEFDTAFGIQTRLTIISEWLKDSTAVDTGGLDNVVLSTVPVPAALPLFVTALCGLGIKRKRHT